ncbi:MAG: DUF2334 domain-containing protein [Synergistaceae bacterium]|nr:DUF2334 domain-containing protein [Synergistaceae bacterium]
MPHILLRFDDICPTMDYKQWNRAAEILEKYDIKPLLGVIPDCKDPVQFIDEYHSDFWDYMKELQNKGYALAMHGCNHVYDTQTRGIINGGYVSEFAGHSYEVQLEKIQRGKRILHDHGIDTDIFFAPAHSYDMNTLKALHECGFRYMSDGMTSKPVIREGVICLPSLFGGLPRIVHSNGYYTTVFHSSEWTRPDKQAGYTNLQKVCEKYHDSIVDFRTYSQQALGNTSLQNFIECYNINYSRHIRPKLSMIKRAILGKRK